MDAEHHADGNGDSGWDLGLDDESTALMKAVGRQIKLWREAAGLTQAELGAELGYSLEMISAVERGRRLAQPVLLESADRVLNAGGKIAAMKDDVAEARYPKKVRDLAKVEREAVEIGAYGSQNMQGLLQTEEYARALYRMRCPAFDEAGIERHVAARMARQHLLEAEHPPLLTFVQEEVTLRRPVGGTAVLRRQLSRLLDLPGLRHVTIQVMPTACEEHAGMGGEFCVLKLRRGATVGFTETQLTSRYFSRPKDVQTLDMRYGMLRSQALPPRESLDLIEQALGDT
ncbi:helix-turn-helix domain-containing protein [Streptomyces chumphonensis]|uniref:helix-turn-helix domain-containing protein n=1 Tax=Streptomyces chumphonensis TaxID=1214925 RepID=UPI003D71F6C9